MDHKQYMLFSVHAAQVLIAKNGMSRYVQWGNQCMCTPQYAPLSMHLGIAVSMHVHLVLLGVHQY